jgi:hypothetical protein
VDGIHRSEETEMNIALMGVAILGLLTNVWMELTTERIHKLEERMRIKEERE